VERIGIAASKISKGNATLYNFYVILISFLVAFFIFIVAGFTVLFALLLIAYVGSEIVPMDFREQWPGVFKVCMVSLTIVTAIFNMVAILRNIKFTKIENHSN